MILNLRIKITREMLECCAYEFIINKKMLSKKGVNKLVIERIKCFGLDFMSHVGMYDLGNINVARAWVGKKYKNELQ